MGRLAISTLLAIVTIAAVACGAPGPARAPDGDVILGLSLAGLPPPPPDPSNAVADDPRAAALGHRLFFDVRLSRDGDVSCATCHRPELGFQDGLPLGVGVGTTTRRTMSIVGAAYSPWQFWDGRKDTLWSQALGPLESAVEHGGDRTAFVHVLAEHHREEYEAVFGPLPDLTGLPRHAGPVADPAARAAWDAMTAADRDAINRAFANLGKAIAAYERRLVPGPSRLDRHVEAVRAGDLAAARRLLTDDERAGLALFVGEARCVQCHGGPLLTNHEFHNTGVPAVASLPEDLGRAAGARDVVADEFNCLGRYSDAPPEACGELRFLDPTRGDLARRYRTPSLRGVAARAPYMHAGQLATLRDVVAHYVTAPAAPRGRSELAPLDLTAEEIDQLVAFLRALDAPVAADPRWLAPPE